MEIGESYAGGFLLERGIVIMYIRINIYNVFLYRNGAAGAIPVTTFFLA